jgi:hypothetical protein
MPQRPSINRYQNSEMKFVSGNRQDRLTRIATLHKTQLTTTSPPNSYDRRLRERQN